MGTAPDSNRSPRDRRISKAGYIRGVYANKDLKPGDLLTEDNIYMVIPLHKGKISVRGLMLSRYGNRMTKGCAKDAPVMIDSPYAENEQLKKSI